MYTHLYVDILVQEGVAIHSTIANVLNHFTCVHWILITFTAQYIQGSSFHSHIRIMIVHMHKHTWPHIHPYPLDLLSS